MTFRTSMIAAGAILALAVPAAGSAASARTNTSFQLAKETINFEHSGQSQALRKSHKLKTSKVSKKAAGKSSKVSKTASGERSKLPVYPVTYILVPGPLLTSGSAVDPNECQDTGDNCSDQQACQFWGMNCDSVDAPVQAVIAPASPSAPVSAITVTPQVSQSTTTTDVEPSNCADYTDYKLTHDMSYC